MAFRLAAGPASLGRATGAILLPAAERIWSAGVNGALRPRRFGCLAASGIGGEFVLRLPGALAPFAVRSYRFQWSADLFTSWATEMEVVLLGWYIAAETGSVLMVTVFGSLLYAGTLVAPFMGLAGDRFGHRGMLAVIRAAYVLLSGSVVVLLAAGMLTPLLVLVLAGIGGMIRPSEQSTRSVLIGEILPDDGLMKAVSLSRITMDSARVAGALAGGGLVAVLGLGHAFGLVVVFYLLGLVLTFGIGVPAKPRGGARGAGSPLGNLVEGARAVWQSPAQLAAIIIAFQVNVTAYPFTLGLLPYVAREVYGTSQAGLGYLVAMVAAGAILASVLLSVVGRSAPPARMVVVFSLAWHALLIGFGQVTDLATSLPVLVLIGAVQQLSLLPMSVLLLRGAPPALRGRIMGLRTLAIYGLPIGLLCAGPVIDGVGFAATAALYGGAGMAATLLVLWRWRADLWPRHAPANSG